METRYWKNQAANRQVDQNSNVQKIKRDIVSQYINPKLISMCVGFAAHDIFLLIYNLDVSERSNLLFIHSIHSATDSF